MKGDFDHKRAWKEIANPGFQALPRNVRDLYERVEKECGNCNQDKDLGLPWPEDSDLKKRFEEIPIEELARAARTIYFYGHWNSTPSNGACWRFAHWADRVLSERLELQRRKDPSGLFYAIHEGFLRICFNSKESWLWEELGIATSTMLEKAKEVVPTNKIAFEKQYHKAVQKLKSLPGWDGGFLMLRPFLDTSDYEEKSEEEQAIIDTLGAESGLKFLNIRNVNHKPHPYVIGPRHLIYADGILSRYTIEAAEKYHNVKCAYKGCYLPYAEHTSDKVIFIGVKGSAANTKVELTDSQKEIIKALAPILEQNKIDGVAFCSEL